MAVFYQGQRVPWTIPGMKPGESINLDPSNFHPEMLPERRIIQGNDQSPLIMIPRLPGRISIRKDGYVELILSRHYDPEAKQTRNKKVIIGKDASGFLAGMMTPNDNYFNLFDARGELFRDPMKEETPEEETREQTEVREETLPETDAGAVPAQKTETEEEPTEKITDEALLKREQAILEKEKELAKRELDLSAWEEELQETQDSRLMEAQDAEREHIQLLAYMLDHYIDAVKAQARRKPDAPMSGKQIRTINEVLGELKAFFAGCETEDYLHLAEEPDPEGGDPGTTCGEMSLLLGAYLHTVNAYLYHKLRKK